MDLFNIWTVATIAVAGYYFIEYKKTEKTAKEAELEKRIEALEKKSE